VANDKAGFDHSMIVTVTTLKNTSLFAST